MRHENRVDSRDRSHTRNPPVQKEDAPPQQRVGDQAHAAQLDEHRAMAEPGERATPAHVTGGYAALAGTLSAGLEIR